MTLALADTNTYSNNTTLLTTHPVNLPAIRPAGNLLLMPFVIHSATNVITPPSGWSTLISETNTDLFRLFGKIADGSEGSTADVGSTEATRSTAVTYSISGNRNGLTSSEIAIAGPVTGSSASLDPPSLTPSWGSDENLWIVIRFTSDGGGTLLTYPANYTLGQNSVMTGTGTGNGVDTCARLLTAASEDPGSFTYSANKNASSYTLAVRPAVITGGARSYGFII